MPPICHLRSCEHWMMAGKVAAGLSIALLCACETPASKTVIAPLSPTESTAGLATNSSASASSGNTTAPRETASRETAPRELVPYDLSKKPALSVQGPAPVATMPAAAHPAISPDPTPVHVALAEQPLIEGPTPVAPPVAPLAAPAPAGTDQAIPMAPIPAAGAAIHLASYLDIAAARRGWEVLSASHIELAPLTPLYVPVDLPGKGHFLRLYATGGNPAALSDICRRLQTSGAYCALSTGR